MSKEYDPKIYVACLADYNNGVLHGDWIDLAGKSEGDVQEEINEILRTSKYPNVTVECPDCEGTGKTPSETDCPMCNGKGEVPSAEEWAIHAFEGFGKVKIGEYENLDKIIELVEKLEERGEIFEVAYERLGDMDEAVKAVRGKYRGNYKSVEDFVQDYYEENYGEAIEALPDSLKYNFDWEAVARDWTTGGDIWTAELEDGNVAIFDNN